MEAIAAQRKLQLGTVQSYIAEAMAAGNGYPWHRMGLPHVVLASLCGQVRHYQKHLQQDKEQQQNVSEQQKQEQARQQNGQLQQGAQQLQQEQQQSTQQLQQEQHQPKQEQAHQQNGQQQQSAQQLQHQDSNLHAKVEQSGQQLHLQPDVIQLRSTMCSCGGVLPVGADLCLCTDGSVCHANVSEAGFPPGVMFCSPAVQVPELHVLEQLVVTGKGTKALRESMDNCLLTHGQMRLGLAHLYCVLHNAVCSCKQLSVGQVCLADRQGQ